MDRDQPRPQGRAIPLAKSSSPDADPIEDALSCVSSSIEPLLERFSRTLGDAISQNAKVKLKSLQIRNLHDVLREHDTGVCGPLRQSKPDEDGFTIFPSNMIQMLTAAALKKKERTEPLMDRPEMTTVEFSLVKIVMERVALEVSSWALENNIREILAGAPIPMDAQTSILFANTSALLIEILAGFGKSESDFIICLPISVVEALRADDPTVKSQVPAISTDEWAKAFSRRIGEVPIKAAFDVDELPMRLRTIRELTVGQIVPIRAVDLEHVVLRIGSSRLYKCRLESDGRRYRVKIIDSMNLDQESPDVIFSAKPTENALHRQRTENMNETMGSIENSGKMESQSRCEMSNADVVLGIPVLLQVVLGSVSMKVSELMKLEIDSVIELDQRVGDPVQIVVNGCAIARGEIVVIDEAKSRYGVSLLDIQGAQPFN